MRGRQREDHLFGFALGNGDFGDLTVGKGARQSLHPLAHTAVFVELIGILRDDVALLVAGVDVDVPAHQKHALGLTAPEVHQQVREAVAPAFGQHGRLFGRALDFHKAQSRQNNPRIGIGVKGLTGKRGALRLAVVHAKTEIDFKVARALGRPHVNFRLDHAPEKRLGGFREQRVDADDGMGHGRVGRGRLAVRQSPKVQIENR